MKNSIRKFVFSINKKKEKGTINWQKRLTQLFAYGRKVLGLIECVLQEEMRRQTIL